LWDPTTSILMQTLEGHSDSVWTVAFSQDGRLLASGSRDRTIKLWDPAIGAVKHTLEGHSDWVRSVAFSQNGRFLASGSYDKTIKLWDPTTGNLKHTLEGHSDWVQSVAFSQNSSGISPLLGSHHWRLQRTLGVGGINTNIEFSKHLPQQITYLGYYSGSK
ncbi:hypothetical protein KXV63_005929, partial [Aspergillus fumigatus]